MISKGRLIYPIKKKIGENSSNFLKKKLTKYPFIMYKTKYWFNQLDVVYGKPTGIPITIEINLNYI